MDNLINLQRHNLIELAIISKKPYYKVRSIHFSLNSRIDPKLMGGKEIDM